MSNKIRNIFFFVGLVAVIIMILTFKVSFVELWQQITHAGHWLVLILGMWVVLYAMNALTWRTIIKGSGECNIPFLHLMKGTISGFSLNYATPVGLMGGEPYKIMEMKPYIGVQRASSSVLLFAMMHIFTHFWYWLTSVVLYVVFIPLDVPITIILILLTAFCIAAIYFFTKGYKNGMVVKTIHFLSKIPGLRKWASSFEEKRKEDLVKIDSQIAALHSQNKKNFYISFFLEYIGRILQSFEIYFMLLIFTDHPAGWMTFVYSIIILAFTSLFANMMFFMPLQLGGREGGFAMSIAQMGMSGQVAMSVSIICRVREVFWTALGLLLIKVGNKKTDALRDAEKSENIDHAE
ncbi:MAG: flippase-like domain-containing protein [Bacteroidaceae bacterium]|nr:flippase-like domain-containing protein [Bacteroidaceae bacterium]